MTRGLYCCCACERLFERATTKCVRLGGLTYCEECYTRRMGNQFNPRDSVKYHPQRLPPVQEEDRVVHAPVPRRRFNSVAEQMERCAAARFMFLHSMDKVKPFWSAVFFSCN